MNARALVKSSSRLIGVLYFQIKKFGLCGPFCDRSSRWHTASDERAQLFTLVHSVTKTDDIGELQKNWKFDGFIAVGFSQELFEEVNRIVQVPIVFIDTHLEDEVFNRITDYPNSFY